MAVVLASEESDIFTSSPLKRSHSQSKFLSKPQSDLQKSSSTSRLSDSYIDSYKDAYQPYHVVSNSNPSSAPSSPRTVHADSTDPSYSSTPATSISLDGELGSDFDDDIDDTIVFPSYDQGSFFPPLEDPEPPASPRNTDSYTASPPDHGTPVTTSRPESPSLSDHAEDDTAVRHHPTQHVDYLSHDWKEEDIWSSWRYIVSKRGEFSNGPRLENASWRTWMKSKNKLKTVSPETLNWLKDCDVTWLYGPLQTRQIKLSPPGTDHGSSTLSRTDSFFSKKPILKKRSMSEVMLQKSLSSSSLLKQAAASIEAQQHDGHVRVARPILHRATTDFATFPFSSRQLSRANSLMPSTSSSGVISPSVERRHIHFDEQVKQCIAVEAKVDEEEEEAGHGQWRPDEGSDSDGDAFMMKRTSSKKRPVRPRRNTKAATAESKTIAMLPSTTLKYREDTPEPRETAMKHSTGQKRSPLISPSSSQETLRPSRPSGRFYEEEDEDDYDPYADDETSTTPLSSPVRASSQSSRPDLQRSASSGSLTAEPAGMRRTESGMFMPYEEGDAQGNEGIFGRVIDTVNTARDIAHVIWNVGWRR